MKSSFILSVLGAATGSLAHGLVSQLLIDGTLYDNFNPFFDVYQNPKPQRIGWTTPNNGPAEDFTAAGIACGVGSTAGSLSAPAACGSSIKFFWTPWPDSHRGPTMTYLAKCPGTDCTTADPTTLDWFKIDHAGFNDGTWISDTIIADNNTRTITIPSDIAPGPYLIRHELLALHSAFDPKGAQFYPMCANLQINGTGSAVPTNTVKFPGAYSPTDPGILINIHYPAVKNYTIPGPAPYVPGGASAPVSPSAVVPSAPTTGFTAAGSGIPTIKPSALPPYGNGTSIRSKPPKKTQSIDSPLSEVAPFGGSPTALTDVSAVPTEVAPTAVPTEVAPTAVPTEVVSTVIQVVTKTMPAVEAVKTVTVTISPPGGQPASECTPVGRYKRGNYGYGI